MVLSIGMIMKNEEKYLRDCLTALQPILDNVDSELIICDTGSTDNSINIAKEFTDNVLEIEWRDDFGWARQQGFQLAKGEWFWYVDPDEIFQDVQAIIDFFNSGEYKNFGCGIIKLNDNPYSNDEGNIADYVRLFKIVDGMQWQDKIHEQLVPFEGPNKYLNATCLHYGYVGNQEFSAAKHKRNLKPILEIYNERPNDYRNIMHLAAEFNHMPETQLKYAEIGIKLAKDTELSADYSSYPCFYPAFAQVVTRLYFDFNEHEKVIDCVNEYFESVPTEKISINACNLKYMQTLSYIKLDMIENAKTSAFAAYSLKKQADNNELSRISLSAGAGSMKVDYHQFIAQILTSLIRLDNFDETITWLKQAILQDDKLDEYKCYASLIGIMFSYSPKMLSDLYLHFSQAQNAQKHNDIITIIESGLNNQSSKIDFAKNLLKKLENSTVENTSYIKLQQLRLAMNENSPVDDYLDYFVQQTEISQIYADVLVAAIKNNKYFEELSQKMNIVSYVNLFNQTIDAMNVPWQVVATNDMLHNLEIIHNFLQQTNFMENFTSAKAVRFICNILGNLKGKAENESLHFELLERAFHMYYKMIYSKEFYCESEVDSLVESDKTTFYLGTAYERKNAGNIADFAKYMRLALKTAPHYKDMIQQITENLQENLVLPTIHDELQQEIANLKAVIYNMIQTGNKTQAQQIFETYVQINPTDGDIAKIRQMLA
ncbi:MAG: glycosyltransferase [Firmicutes bacterium]|nr:glycosyltransferase [Bacillota bacterium]